MFHDLVAAGDHDTAMETSFLLPAVSEMHVQEVGASERLSAVGAAARLPGSNKPRLFMALFTGDFPHKTFGDFLRVTAF